MSDETAAAYTKLAGVIDKIVPGNGIRDELVSAIDDLIENKIADAIEALADRVQDASGLRP